MMRIRKTSKVVLTFVFLAGFLVGTGFGYFVLSSFVSQSNAIEFVMIYSSEKQGWIEELTPLFIRWWETHYPNVTLRVIFRPLGTIDSLISIITGSIQPVIWSPASSIWLPVANYLWKQEYGDVEPLVLPGSWNATVITPIVIATWENYAKEHNITSFEYLYQLAKKPNSDLKYAHTNPQLSNSGFMAVLLQLVAATKKPMENITLNDLTREDVREWFRTLESRAVYYGSSTGFLVDHAVDAGPRELNVVVAYENLILEKNLNGEPQARWNQKLVVVYPEEGVILSDHPFVILNAPWVSDTQKWVAREFIKFVLGADIQKLALKHGFRPANPEVPLNLDYFNAKYGVSPNITVPINKPPHDVNVLLRVSDLWAVTRAEG